MRQKILLFAGCMACCALFAGCGSKKEAEAPAIETETPAAETKESESEEESAESTVIVMQTIAGWEITVENCRMDKSLENISVDLGYTGVETSDFKKEAGEGNVFCLVKLKIEKQNSKEVIDWQKMKLTDEDGNEYTRIEDAFLTDLGMMRMSGTALNFGSNEGWIAFEIAQTDGALTLSYPFETEEFSEVIR